MSSLLLYFVCMLLIIQVRSDGYFPFPKNWPPDCLIFMVLPFTVILGLLILYTAHIFFAGKKTEILNIPDKINYALLALAPMFALLLIAKLQLMQAKYFGFANYRLNEPVFVALILAGFAPLILFYAYAWLKKSFNLVIYLLAVLASVLIVKVIPLLMFPITAVRSDLLPILAAAGKSILSSHNPYQYYLLDNGVLTQTVRFPGLILAYLPAVWLNFDLRLVTLLCEAAICLILIYLVKQLVDKGIIPWQLIWAVLLLFMLPYWHYRHELYEAPFWLILIINLLCLYWKKPAWFGITLGLMAGMHQWGILFFPFLLIAYVKRFGKKNIFMSLICSSAVFGIIFLFFVLPNFALFMQNVFGFYQKVYQAREFFPMSMYFTPMLNYFGLVSLTLPIQLLLIVWLLYASIKRVKTMQSVIAVLALALYAVISFNSVSWTYQYLLILLLFVMGFYFRYAEE